MPVLMWSPHGGRRLSAFFNFFLCRPLRTSLGKPKWGPSKKKSGLARSSTGALPAPPQLVGPAFRARVPSRIRKKHMCMSTFLGPRPTSATFRANPSPEVTDPVCRLPLPTLLYRPEAAHLGDLLRKFGTARREALRRLRSVFQGPPRPAGRPGAYGHAGRSSPPRPYRAATAFQGFSGSGRKDNSSRRPRQRHRVSLGRPVGLRPGPPALNPSLSLPVTRSLLL